MQRIRLAETDLPPLTWDLVISFLAASASASAAPVIDTLAAGYGKVLGKGRLPNVPVIVKARFVSALAEKKIKAAGGVVELIA